uniref:Uncharacterized protein n=1 Tax=Lactuca sativa TaxID=4236 RepID=A0A9R1XTS4_LACSA|nr:hypothetical protein LSAT_V11C300137780 [Lactuca sativa]
MEHELMKLGTRIGVLGSIAGTSGKSIGSPTGIIDIPFFLSMRYNGFSIDYVFYLSSYSHILGSTSAQNNVEATTDHIVMFENEDSIEDDTVVEDNNEV